MKPAACWLTLAALLLAGPAFAQSPPTTLLAGTSSDNFKEGETWCRIVGGPTFFQRLPDNGSAMVTLGELHYSVGSYSSDIPNVYYVISGQGRLNFATSTTGQIQFINRPDLPVDVRQPSFTGYAQTYDPVSRVLNVNYTVRFPNCALGVKAAYRE